MIIKPNIVYLHPGLNIFNHSGASITNDNKRGCAGAQPLYGGFGGYYSLMYTLAVRLPLRTM